MKEPPVGLFDEPDHLVEPCRHGRHLFIIGNTEQYAVCGICQSTIEIRLGEIRDRFGRLLEKGL